MIRYLAVVLLVVGVCGVGAAQESVPFRACSGKAKTQAEMNKCASQEAARVDAQLEDSNQKLLAKVAEDSDAVAGIKAMQAAWAAYRDAYIEAMYPAKDKQAVYGSVYPMEVDLVRAKLTRQQVAAVKELLRRY